MRTKQLGPNVNVPLAEPEQRPNVWAGKSFPCPMCAVTLAIRIARTQKPYCVCMDCGIQIFFRGKVGIARLERIIEDELLVAGAWSSTNTPEVLFNRIQHLKQRKAELKHKQRLFFQIPTSKMRLPPLTRKLNVCKVN